MSDVPLQWTDTHCHLGAREFDGDRADVVVRARAVGVRRLVLPAVAPFDFEAVRELAHAHDAVYALGIHPLYVEAAAEEALDALRQAIASWRDDPHLVAIGEIGLDHFVPGLDRAKQQRFYAAQLEIARAADLPVLLHVRRSADALLQQLRRVPVRGIAHAFNGSRQQAETFVGLGFKLGFGGALTFEPARQLRRLARELPLDALVLETDAPDMPPHWLYTPAAERAAGRPMGRNEPAELPRIAAELASLRGLGLAELAAATEANARAALPRLALFEASLP